MKNKNVLRYIYNPFEKIAGWQALISGLIIVFLSGWIGKQANLMFDGAIDAHFGKEVTYYQTFMMLFYRCSVCRCSNVFGWISCEQKFQIY